MNDQLDDDVTSSVSQHIDTYSSPVQVPHPGWTRTIPRPLITEDVISEASVPLHDIIANSTIEQLKNFQKTYRRNLTTTCKFVLEKIHHNHSRQGVKILFSRVNKLVDKLEILHEHISLNLTTQIDRDIQMKRHLEYIETATTTREKMEEYFTKRKDDAPSEDVATVIHNVEQLEKDEEDNDQDQEREIPTALKNKTPSLTAVNNVVDKTNNVSLGELVRRPQQKSLPTQLMNPTRCPTSQWVNQSSQLKRSTLPDEWISYHSTSIRTKLEPYNGNCLEWFSWIDLFHALVHQTTKLPGEKLAILKSSLQGKVKNIILGSTGGEDSYKEALRCLKFNCGRRDVMRAGHLLALKALNPANGDPTGFKQYADRVRSHLFDLSRIGETSHADIIEGITQKLQLNDRLSWNEGRFGELEIRTMDEFGEWLCRRAAAYQNANVIAAEQANDSRSSNRQTGRRHDARAHKSSSSKEPEQPKTKSKPFCFNCKSEEHWIESCSTFAKLTVGERANFAYQHRLCFGCLWSGHSSKDCRKKKQCPKSGCKLSHHILLHDDEKAGTTTDAASHSAQSTTAAVALGVIRLDVIDVNGSLVSANALIDEGSDSTLIRAGLAKQLGLTGINQKLRIEGTGGIRTEYTSQIIKLRVRLENGETVEISGSTMPKVANAVPVINWKTLRQQWTHLSDLPIQSSGGQVDILLGVDYVHLTVPIECRVGRPYEPVASRSQLGWIVRGVVGTDTKVKSAHVHSAFTSSTLGDGYDELAVAVRRFSDTESFGTEHHAEGMSTENRRASKMLQDSLRKLDVGYEAPVTWKVGEPNLVNNYPLALSTNQRLRRRFAQDPAFENKYRGAMQVNFDEGYAVRLTEQEQLEQAPFYYLSHFGVYKNGPEGKLRIVFNAAAKFKGKSLNDSINVGPTLLNSLPAVVIKFREGAVAWASDIKAMYSRIRLTDRDSNYHRFIWPEEDGTDSICKMLRVTFGVNCSPFVAISTIHRVADDAGPDRGEITKAIRNNIYVDDYLGSAQTVDQGLAIATGVRDILVQGDFHLRGWTSNSQTFLDALCSIDKELNETTHSLSPEDTETVLGVNWKPSTDVIGFRVASIHDVTFTRIGLLSKVAGLFDPLGSAAPLTVKAKIRLRQLDGKNLNWTTTIEDEDKQWWESWFQTLWQLRLIEFPRCLLPEEKDITRLEIHTFCDASIEAYAAVVYLRIVYQDQKIIIRQVKAGTKLAPKKTLSIPKLELNAAVLGARLTRFVHESLTRPINQRFLWTDSSIVRNWIRSTSSFYQTFVSHRIGEIQSITETEEWRFIPGKLNPADGATRSNLECEALPVDWLNGPEFLYEAEERWPEDVPWMVIEEEKKVTRIHHGVSSVSSFDWTGVIIEHDKLGAFLEFQGQSVEFIRQAQQESYPEDLERLRRGKDLRSTSSLLGFTPFLDSDGLLRLGGRVGRAKLPYDRLHPFLLPGRHPLSEKLIAAFHQKLHHAGIDFILTHIRQHVWMTGGREAVKRYRGKCRYCLLQRGKPAGQLMGELPLSRLDIDTPPFTHTAVDYFGPIEVSRHRGKPIKRWGALFACAVTRAVYVDVASSMSSDDFLLVFRRFIGLYGRPRHVYSDNGTNFIGAERELRDAINQLQNSVSFQEALKYDGIQWHFQPARAPHFGGAHESLVRSTKRAMYAALASENKGLRYPTENVLQTLLFEISGLLNSRPLTEASSDPNDLRPLTPNDFFNRPPTSDVPAGNFKNALPNKLFPYVQRLRGLFVSMWRRTYLQSISDRSKWRRKQTNLKVGDLVAEINPQGRHIDWSTGRIEKVYPGQDGMVRVVDVRLPNGLFRRPIHGLCLLDTGSTEAETPVSGENGAEKQS